MMSVAGPGPELSSPRERALSPLVMDPSGISSSFSIRAGLHHRHTGRYAGWLVVSRLFLFRLIPPLGRRADNLDALDHRRAVLGRVKLLGSVLLDELASAEQ